MSVQLLRRKFTVMKGGHCLPELELLILAWVYTAHPTVIEK
jgi:hypothetical protein